MIQTRPHRRSRIAKRLALVPMLVVALSPTAPALAAHTVPKTRKASTSTPRSHVEFFRKVG